jgi:hypothetical protein
MATTEDCSRFSRIVIAVDWRVGQAGEPGYWSVRLACGHETRWMPAPPIGRAVCLECVRAARAPEKVGDHDERAKQA